MFETVPQTDELSNILQLKHLLKTGPKKVVGLVVGAVTRYVWRPWAKPREDDVDREVDIILQLLKDGQDISSLEEVHKTLSALRRYLPKVQCPICDVTFLTINALVQLIEDDVHGDKPSAQQMPPPKKDTPPLDTYLYAAYKAYSSHKRMPEFIAQLKIMEDSQPVTVKQFRAKFKI